MKQKLIIVLLAFTACASLGMTLHTKANIEPVEIQGIPIEQTEQQKTVEQQYIVRYGVTYDYGNTIITEDGNEWTLIDAPEYEDGTEVRVLFDSNKTETAIDDIIIEVYEK